MTSSMHTAPDFPSSPFIISSTSLHILIQPEMDSDKRLWAMEEELTANWMKTKAIELALKAIMNKLEVSVPEEPAMEEEFSFRRNSRTISKKTLVLYLNIYTTMFWQMAKYI